MDYSFQIGLDIATALSVIGASGVFMWNQKKAIESTVRETLKVQKFRFIEELGSFSLSLAESINAFKRLHTSISYLKAEAKAEGRSVSEDVKRMMSELHVKFNDVTAEQSKLLDYINFVMSPAFDGLAAVQERQIMDDAKKDILDWHSDSYSIYMKKKEGELDFTRPQEIISRTITDLLRLERAL
jgi:hypothetical protein